ncbi:NADPH-dependent F420 reductase [Tahibacter amnicola]|uniref:NAD(P)-binding domain-containing protein n=1 Tax=Tahibacter amnicola TaxID=2976241 RepID=A0ABY6BGT5_9GAMM|nr:NAD(P)-binding domain-containing protein [Tahibacter amnicola]UXI68806.1 NAD(P)-binding domain-containing protein [Tahibacter amnicola]
MNSIHEMRQYMSTQETNGHTRADTIGILGTGRMGVRLAALFARVGHTVILGSRDPARAARIAEGLALPGIRGGRYDEAAAAPIVIPAAFVRDGLFDLLETLRPALEGKLLIDISNPFNATYDDFLFDWNTSSAEEIQKRFPRTRVVGAFKNVWWEVFDTPQFDGQVSDVFVVGDDEAARAHVIALGQGTPFRYIDAGALKNARTVERMTLLAGELGQRYAWFPRMNWRLLGEAWTPGVKDPIRALIAR